MKILKVEAFSGLSGDMFLGALADLTDAHDELKQLPQKLHLENVEVKISNVEKAGIACRHIKIIDHNIYKGHSHSHSHSHDHDTHSHEHDHTHSHSHEHEHSHSHEHQHTHDHHRHLKDIEKIIDNSHLTANAKKIAKNIFVELGKAESKVHGVDINTIHFHEVGAIDSILDIVGSAMLLDKLDIHATVSTAICTGHGFVMADHGRMPIPAPATKELLTGIPSYSGDAKGEMTTPTGAAILRYLQPSFEIPVLIEKKIGHGPGEKDFEHPNVLRLSLCENVAQAEDEVFMVETNIDDMSAELLGSDFQDQLLSSGAIDFYFTQVTMKKGRPGLLITVFTEKKHVKHLADFLLENTTTIGVRNYAATRKILPRSQKKVKSSIGDVDVKEVELPSGKKRRTVEYESAKKISKKLEIPISEVFSILNKEL